MVAAADAGAPQPVALDPNAAPAGTPSGQKAEGENPGVTQLASIAVTPDSPTLAVGETRAFTAKGYDANGNEVPIPQPQWDVNTDFGYGAVDPNDPSRYTFTATRAGTGGIVCYDLSTGTYVDDSTPIYILSSGQLARMDVAPTIVNLHIGGQQQFTSIGYDANGNQVPITSAWTTTGGGTLSNTTGSSTTYTATAAGEHTTTATDQATGIKATATIQITDAGTARISGSVYADVNDNGVRELHELGIGGVTVTIDGPVTANTLTAADGSYRFENLPPGTYTIREVQPPNYNDGKDTAGQPKSGSVQDDRFVNVTLEAGVDATDYNFGERGLRSAMVSLADYLASSGTQVGDTPSPPPDITAKAALAGEASGRDLAGEPVSQAALDVSGDAWITALDALLVIDRVNAVGAAPPAGEGEFASFDTNRDGSVTPGDVLLLVNHLNRDGPGPVVPLPAGGNAAAGEGEAVDLILAAWESADVLTAGLAGTAAPETGDGVRPCRPNARAGTRAGVEQALGLQPSTANRRVQNDAGQRGGRDQLQTAGPFPHREHPGREDDGRTRVAPG